MSVVPTIWGMPCNGWYSPEGLTALLKRDEAAAYAQLATESFDYGFVVRDTSSGPSWLQRLAFKEGCVHC
jgi:hypothetical protein